MSGVSVPVGDRLAGELPNPERESTCTWRRVCCYSTTPVDIAHGTKHPYREDAFHHQHRHRDSHIGLPMGTVRQHTPGSQGVLLTLCGRHRQLQRATSVLNPQTLNHIWLAVPYTFGASHRMQANTVVAVLSIIPLALGIVLIVMRTKVSAMNAHAQRSFFGKGGETRAQRSTPTAIMFVGFVAIAIGAFALIAALSGAQF